MQTLPSQNASKTLFELQWEVPIQGFTWVRAKPTDGLTAVETRIKGAQTHLYLTEVRSPKSPVADYRRYSPLTQHSGLFRAFAQIKPVPQEILAFANAYGRLGHVITNIHPLAPQRESEIWRSERLASWTDAILSMRFAVRLWDLAKARDLTGLAQHVHWFGTDRVVCASNRRWWSSKIGESLPPGERAWTISQSLSAEMFAQIRPGDLIVPALYAMQLEMNAHLVNSSARLLWNRTHARQELCFLPFHLLGALWLQFAQSVDGNTGYKQCPECGQWFAVAPGTARADKLYCSNTCRARGHRTRQLEAQ